MSSQSVKSIIAHQIFLIRKQKVMIDRDLANLYQVTTKALNQAVKRNKLRFPEDFMFQLTKREKDQLVTNCDRFKALKHSSSNPYAFTEQGVAMLSTVLNSERAIKVNIEIMRTFVQIRQILHTNKDLADKLRQMEQKIGIHNQQIQAVFEAIRQLMSDKEKPKGKIGFHVDYK